MTKKFPKSIRKFLRKEKARIRQQFLESGKQKEEIAALFEKIKKTDIIKNNKGRRKTIK